MPKVWIIKPNVPEDWDFDGVGLEAGKRNIKYWIDQLKYKKYIQYLDINEKDDGCEFLNKLSETLNCTSDSHVNTVQVYKHPKYTIECTYRSDLNFQNSQEFNYFGTVVNIESINMFGIAVFFKISDKKLVDLDLEELGAQIVNFYFLKTFKLVNQQFEEIGMINFEPEINRRLDGYRIRKIGDWLIFSDDKKSNLENLKKSGNNIEEFNNLIWLKMKTHIGDISEALETVEYEKNKDGDLRGLYMDLNPEYIISVFF